MIPVHFGRSDRILFGLYTPAVEPRARRGVVICNPWGMEALRAHRTLRQLAQMLAQRGLDVLRFDYSGTGDSFGDLASLRLADWVEDTEMAVDELHGMSGATHGSVVGLRLGSYVAAKVGSRRPREIDRVVLWEPVVQGQRHVSELTNGKAGTRIGDLGTTGFPLPDVFREDLASASLEGLSAPRLRVHMIHSRGEPVAPTSISAKEVVVTHDPSPACWVEEREFGAGAVPVELLKKMVEWLR